MENDKIYTKSGHNSGEDNDSNRLYPKLSNGIFVDIKVLHSHMREP